MGVASMLQPRDSGGHEPDYRFTFANERTFLAWIRTSLALDAAGLAVVGFLPPMWIPFGRQALGLALIALGTFLAAASLRQWARNQAALRHDEPLPVSHLPRALAFGVVLIAALGAALILGGTAP